MQYSIIDTKGVIALVVYLDILFLVNLIMNYILLIITSALSGVYTKRWRVFASSVIGCVYAMMVFFMPTQVLTGMITKVLVGFLMVLVSFGYKYTLKVGLMFFVVSFAFAGAIMCFFYMYNSQSYMMINGVPYIDISVNILVGAFLVCYVVLSVVYKDLGKNKGLTQNITELNLSFGQKQTKVSAFKDTGNSLCDNITGKPVIVVEADALKNVLPMELRFILKDDPIQAIEFAKFYPNDLKLRLITYNVLGGSGTMLVIKPTKVLSKAGKKLDVLIGISPKPVEIAGCTAIMGV